MTLGTFTLNLTGNNTLALFAFIDGPSTFTQTATDTTTLTDIIEAQGTTLSLVGGTFNEASLLWALGSTITLDTNFRTMGSSTVQATFQGVIAISGGSASTNFELSNGGTLSIASGALLTNSSIAMFDAGNGTSTNNIIFKNQTYGSYAYDGTTLTIGPYNFSDTGDAGKTFYLYASGADTILSTNPSPACFLEGTTIHTARGAVAVEHLLIGDDVITLYGNAAR